MPAEALYALIAMAAFFGTFAAVLSWAYWYTKPVRATFPHA